MSKPAKTEQAALPMDSHQLADRDSVPAGTRAATIALPAITSAESLIAKAIDAGVPIETMERLLAMRTQLKAEQAKEAYFAALSAFQAEMPVVPKTKKVSVKSERGSYDYWYAPLDEIVTLAKPLLAKHGLSYTMRSEFTETAVIANCILHHVGGHSETSSFRAPVDRSARMNDTQKNGSARTYGNRYAFCDATGILTGDSDDDARSAGDKRPENDRPTTGDAPTVQALWDFAKKKGVALRSILAEFKREEMKDLTAIERVECMQMLVDTPDPVGDQP